MPLSPRSLKRNQSLQEQAYQALKTAILSGELAPGQRLVEVQLAKQDTFRDHLGVAFLVAGISTILALITLASEEEFLAQSAHDWLVELLRDEFVSVHLEDVALALSNGALST